MMNFKGSSKIINDTERREDIEFTLIDVNYPNSSEANLNGTVNHLVNSMLSPQPNISCYSTE